ncbi:hypothetical protein BDA96_02G426300 [Sorghum bicolor]|uniref:GRF-type domain-containing protein n=2 Tax=Sorghum bicolor TaxID=4558 RepID=A0A921RVU3_SORBI|nr:uncharacterized protein LOC8072262 [Sorghum bicolor]KAG0546187.1 hypothetical protein BDA96_02G426300 [Sorghum bicolor]KXG36867.1 hypothetical protein SORBI_3002G405700 [Sorghum bicolor]|eukprot:XP_021307912.1 uncharacterized protein LOC8072262 [Sorghum bicolor]
MSQTSSAGSSRQGGLGYDGRGLPVPYRVPPLAYEPSMFCNCKPKLKAKRFISWSQAQPGRRYLRCQKVRSCDECGFYQWVDEECSPWYKQLLRDLRDAVWTLKDDLAAKEGELQALSNQLVALEVQLEEKKKEADEKQVELDLKHQELDLKQQELNDKEQQLIAKQVMLEGNDMALEAMKGKLKTKNQCIDALVLMCLVLVVFLSK